MPSQDRGELRQNQNQPVRIGSGVESRLVRVSILPSNTAGAEP